MSEIYSLIKKVGQLRSTRLLLRCGSSKNGRGTAGASDEDHKDIYPILARKYKSTPSNVEHNIRTLINLCWMSTEKLWKKLQDVLWKISRQTVNS